MPKLEGWLSLSLSSQAAVAATFPHLKNITLESCSKLEGVPLSWSPVESVSVKRCNGMILQDLPCLPSLHIWWFDELNQLNYFPGGTLRNLTALQVLAIENCKSLKALPVELKNLIAVTELRIGCCYNLVSLGEEGEGGLRNLSSLKTHNIYRCNALKRLPEIDKTSLVYLRIADCPQLEFSTEDFEQLVSLEKLELHKLPKLTSFPEGIKHTAAKLKHLSILGCSEDDARMDLPDHGVGTLVSLKWLSIDAPNNRKVLPQWLQHLTALQNLCIFGCGEELERRWKNKDEHCFNTISYIPVVELNGIENGGWSLEFRKFRENMVLLQVNAQQIMPSKLMKSDGK